MVIQKENQNEKAKVNQVFSVYAQWTDIEFEAKIFYEHKKR